MFLILKMVIGWALGTFLSRILVGAGLTFFTYQGMDALITNMLDQAASSFDALGNVAQILYIMGVGQSLSIIGSAMLTAVTFYSARLFLGSA